ncbi:MAG: RNA ligase family protein [Nitrososphaerota archaeon]|nr:RNA ligase family protein [Ferrimicrobium acidiphilum]MDG6933681.1 RNA ligase family protein [Nitrososphaerota archaeon]
MSNQWLELPDAHMRFRIERIPAEKEITGKHYLSQTNFRSLFQGKVVVEEKLDGKQVTKIFTTETGKTFILCGEYMRYVHSIQYDRLPGLYIVWDVYDPSANTFVGYDDKVTMSHKYNFPIPPLVFQGTTTYDKVVKLLDRKSSFGREIQEGIVVKSLDSKHRGKIVRHEFVAGVELQGHWTRIKGLVKKNRVSYGQETWQESALQTQKGRCGQ